MIPVRFVLLLLIACFTLWPAPARAGDDDIFARKTITIAADAWCPINCEPGDALPGIGITLAKAVFEPLGYTVDYIVMPWARALQQVRQGEIDAVVGANEEDDDTLVYPKTAVSDISDDFYVRIDNPLAFTSVKALKGQRLGVIHDYGYEPRIQKLIASQRMIPGMIQEIAGETALDQNTQKLLAGRIDVLVESRIVMDYRIRQLGLNDKIRRIGGVPQGRVYLGFSPARPESADLAAAFDKGAAQLKKTGVLQALYAAYGMEP